MGKIISIFVFLSSVANAADNNAKVAPAAATPAPAPAAQPIGTAATAVPANAATAAASLKYNLRNLKPLGMSQLLQGTHNRELLQFQNEQGKQNILYEEVTTQPTLKEINRLAPFLASTAHTCSIDLECKAKAFCTDNCRSLFYEVSNSPNDPQLAEKSNCTLRAFTCLTEGQASRAVATTPAPVQAAPAPTPLPVKGP